MAVRTEKVVLQLEDQFTTKMAKAAAVTALLDRALKDLDGSSADAQRGVEGLNGGNGLPALDRNAQKADRSINQLTGRLRLAAEVSASLGPALIPLGAASLPGIAAMATGAGALASGLGVTVLAITGMSDALEALNTYQAEPTAANLQAMRVELEKLGPDAAQFTAYLDSLEPRLRSLQLAARAGLLPGTEEGIEGLLESLPQVRRIISEISTATGGLAADAGEALGGAEFKDFRDWLDRRGADSLDEFARSLGNFGVGLANLLVGFDPATRDFSAGLLEMSRAFAQWSAGLEDNDSFQAFLAYVRESGPEALDLIGSLIELLAGIATAAAPIGDVVLPVLTEVVDILATIAGSDAGAPIIALVAATAAWNRALAVTRTLGATTWGAQNRASIAGMAASLTMVTSAQDRARLSSVALARAEAARATALRGGLATIGKNAAALGGLALATSGVAESSGLANTASGALVGTLAGPWGSAVGAGVGLVLDLASANNDLEAAVQKADLALASTGSLDRRRQAIEESRAGLEQEVAGLEESNSRIRKLTGLIPVAGPYISSGIDKAFGNDVDNAEQKSAELGDELGRLRGLANLLAPAIGLTGDELYDAAGAAERFSGALAELSGWLDKRQALRDYRASLKDLSEGLRNGFQAPDAERLDTVARGILQVADSIKSVRVRNDFLAGARSALDDLATKSGPKARGEIQQVINKFDQLGLTKIPPKKIDADTREADRKLTATERLAQELSRGRYNPTVVLDAAAAQAELRGIRSGLDGLRDRTVRVRIVQEGRVPTGFGPQSATSSADGSTVPKTGRGYADRHLYLLADGEEVISNRWGQADRHRSLLKDINANRLAEGGTAGDKRREPAWKRNPNSAGLDLSGIQSKLRSFENALDRSTNRLSKETAARDDLVSRMSEIGSSAVGAVRSDIFATPSSPWQASNVNADAQLRQDLAEGRELMTIINSLRDKGVTGPLLAELLGKQDLDLARMYNSLPADVLSNRVELYREREQVLGQLSSVAGDAGYGPELREQTAVMQAVQAEVRELRKDVKDQTKTLDKASDRNSEEVTKGVNGGASKGQRNRPRGKRHGAGIK